MIPPLLAQRLIGTEVPLNAPVVTLPAVSLEEFSKHPTARQVVILPAGSSIPLKIEISGNLFRAGNSSELPLVLNEPVEIIMDNGKPTGDWRFPGENWLLARETRWISIPFLKAELTQQTGPEIRTSLVFEPKHQPAH
jgi:hypothetical protein